MKTNIAIIIPLYNEEKRIPKTYKILKDWSLKQKIYNTQILLVDDGSNDNTVPLIKILSNENTNTQVLELNHVGQQNAVISGLKKIQADYYVIMEADGPVDPEYLETFYKYIKIYDVVQGSRILKDKENPTKLVGKRLIRRIISHSLSKIFNIIFSCNIKDPQIGFKVLSQSVVKTVIPTLKLKHDGMKMSELIVRSHASGFKLKEIPVNYYEYESERLVPTKMKDFPKLIKITFKCLMALTDIYFTMKKENKIKKFTVNPFNI